MSVSLEQDDQVIRLLDNKSIEKHKKDGYNFIHFGMIQVAAKLMCVVTFYTLDTRK